MGSNIHLKEKAIALRRNGESYNDIRKILSIKSKGTLSLWFKDLKLSRKSQLLLRKNNKLAHARGLFKSNKIRRDRIDKENSEAFNTSLLSIQKISKKELLLIGASLYWAEGTKSEKRAYHGLTFSNSDPLMIMLFMRFVREVLKIPEARIRAGIHIYPSIKVDDARKFWSDKTGLPQDRFYIITQISRASLGKRPFNTLPYGTIAIKVNSRIVFHKIMGMIAGIVKKTIS